MPLILAIEPDPAQAAAVRRAMRAVPTVDLVLVDSRNAALAALADAVPAVILMSAILPPGDEAALTAHLRTRRDASHVEMITIPLLDAEPSAPSKRRGLLGVFKRSAKHDNHGRVSPRVFANEIKKHLELMQEALAAAPEEEAEREPVKRELVERALVEEPVDREIAARGLVEREPVELTSDPEEFPTADPAGAVPDLAPGVHISEVLARASEHSLVADLPAALFMLRRLLSRLASLERETGVAPRITAERIIVTARAEVVISAGTIEDERGRQEPGDPRASIRQVALIGMSLMLGHTLEGVEHAGALLSDVGEVAAIRVSDAFATLLQSWFGRATGVVAADPFVDLADARAALDEVERSGCTASRRALRTFLKDLPLDNFDTPENAALEAEAVRAARARHIARRTAPAIIQDATPAWEAIQPLEAIESARRDEAIVEVPLVEWPDRVQVQVWADTPSAEPTDLPVIHVLANEVVADPLEVEAERQLEVDLADEIAEAARVVPSPAEPADEIIAAAAALAGGESWPGHVESASVDVGAGSVVDVPDSGFWIGESRNAEPESATPPVVAQTFRSAEFEVPDSGSPPVVVQAFRPARFEAPDSGSPPVVVQVFRPAEFEAQDSEFPPVVVQAFRPAGFEAPRSGFDIRESDIAEVETANEQPETPERAEETTPSRDVDQPLEVEPRIETYVIQESDLPDLEFPDTIAAQPMDVAATSEPVERAEYFDRPNDEVLSPELVVAQHPEPRTTNEEPANWNQQPAEEIPVHDSVFRFEPSDLPDLDSTDIVVLQPTEATLEAEPVEPLQFFEAPTAEPVEAISAQAAAEQAPIDLEIDTFAAQQQEPIAEAPVSADVDEPSEVAPQIDPLVVESSDLPDLDLPDTIVAQPIEMAPELEAVQPSQFFEAPDAEPVEAVSAPLEIYTFGAHLEKPKEEAEVSGEIDEPREMEPRIERFAVESIDLPDLDLPEPIVAQPIEAAAAPESAQWSQYFDPPKPERTTWNPEPAPSNEESDATSRLFQEIDAAAEQAARRRDDAARPSGRGSGSTFGDLGSQFFEAPVPEPGNRNPDPARAKADAGTRNLHADIGNQEPERPIAAAVEETRPWNPIAAAVDDGPADDRGAHVAPEPSLPPRIEIQSPDDEQAPPDRSGFGETLQRLFRSRKGASEVSARPAAVASKRAEPSPKVQGPITRKAPLAQRSRGLIRAAAALVVVAGLAAGGRAYYLRTAIPEAVVVKEAPKARPIGKPVGRLAITSEPPGANIVVDGKRRGITPLTVPDLPVGSHTVLLESKAGSVRRTVIIKAGMEARLDESIFEGWLVVFAPFELKISEGTRLIGTTDSGKIIIPPGRHDIVLTNKALGYRETRALEIRPGETVTVNIEAAEGIVHINTAAGVEVFVDGRSVGATPLGDLRVAAGSREFLLKHPQFGERRVVVDVTLAAPIEVNVDFSK